MSSLRVRPPLTSGRCEGLEEDKGRPVLGPCLTRRLRARSATSPRAGCRHLYTDVGALPGVRGPGSRPVAVRVGVLGVCSGTGLCFVHRVKSGRGDPAGEVTQWCTVPVHSVETLGPWEELSARVPTDCLNFQDLTLGSRQVFGSSSLSPETPLPTVPRGLVSVQVRKRTPKPLGTGPWSLAPDQSGTSRGEGETTPRRQSPGHSSVRSLGIREGGRSFHSGEVTVVDRVPPTLSATRGPREGVGDPHCTVAGPGGWEGSRFSVSGVGKVDAA